MARPSEGFKTRNKGGIATVRFRWDGVDYERSTGVPWGEPGRVAAEAAKIYAGIVSRPVKRKAKAAVARSQFESQLARWALTLPRTLDPDTVDVYLGYAETHWLPFFGAAGPSSATASAYVQHRLGKVLPQTVRHELSALRKYASWAQSVGEMGEIVVPSVPKLATGTPHIQRRRVAAIEISAAEVEALINALPEWSTSKKVKPFPIRARFRVQYETGLRPTLIDLLESPTHYRQGQAHLVVTPEIEKERLARRVPLSPVARRELDAIVKPIGVIFGHHDYREHIAKAAKESLPPDRAALFTSGHLRSARVTHWLEAGAPLPAVMGAVGHTQISTTSRYLRHAEQAVADLVTKYR